MASMRDIKRRKESVQSTGQITKAMKLVATVKLQKAKTRAEQTKPYFHYMYSAVKAMLEKSGNVTHRFLEPGKSEKVGIIVITSNRGLAGGYNSNIIKLVKQSGVNKKDAVIYAVGRKGHDAFVRLGYEVAADYSEVMENPMYTDAAAIGEQVLKDFEEGKIGKILLAYTEFKNTVSHIPTLVTLLPVDVSDDEEQQSEENTADKLTMMNYEPEEEALDMIIPKYVNSLIYGGLMQSFASENGARMQAMDSATSNADDMISDLTLKYNRARQSSITQELTEIIGGANAIS